MINLRVIKFILFLLLTSVLILQNHIAAVGIQEGIDLCIKSVIPALFPFLILTPLMYQFVPGFVYKWFMPFRQISGIPAGSESIFLIGLLSGYPNGARLIVQAWKNNQISKNTALRMLGFCNNAGPAFIFGICSTVLPLYAIWAIWSIHILSAMITACLLPGKTHEPVSLSTNKLTLADSVWSATKTIALICAWILVFRVIISFVNEYSHPYIPKRILSFISGILEITNGILLLDHNSQPGLRFVLITTYISWGGLCVAAQIISVTKDLGTGFYFPGKILQCSFSFLLAYITQQFIFEKAEQYNVPFYILLISITLIIAILILLKSKITVAFQKKVMYNASIS